MASIIISYRRSDSQAIAGRIRDALAAHYGASSVFMDIDNIPFGTDFRDHIEDTLNKVSVLVAIVGPKWLGPRKGEKTRIHDDSDPVRVEIDSALQRKIPVVPVLVGGAMMPAAAALPESMRDFAFRNAASVDAGRDFHLHMDRLIRCLDGILGPRSSSYKTWLPLPKRLLVGLGLTAGSAAMAIAAVLVARLATPDPPTTKPAPLAAKPMKANARGGPLTGPPPTVSIWEMSFLSDMDKSLVRLEASGPNRDFWVMKPNEALRRVGALADSWIFTGQSDGKKYKGMAWAYVGTCGKYPYEVEGPILNDMTTVVLGGKAPRVDPVSCQPGELQDEKLVFNFKYRE